MERDLVNVIENIIAEIPSTEEDFINELNDRLGRVTYSAPELITMWWGETYRTLFSHIPEIPTKEWQFRIMSIFSKLDVDIIKENVRKAQTIIWI